MRSVVEMLSAMFKTVFICQLLFCICTERPTLMFKKDLGDHVIRVEAGQTVSLECEAGGRPVPTIHWLFDGSRMVQVSVSVRAYVCVCVRMCVCACVCARTRVCVGLAGWLLVCSTVYLIFVVVVASVFVSLFRFFSVWM